MVSNILFFKSKKRGENNCHTLSKEVLCEASSDLADDSAAVDVVIDDAAISSSVITYHAYCDSIHFGLTTLTFDL